MNALTPAEGRESGSGADCQYTRRETMTLTSYWSAQISVAPPLILDSARNQISWTHKPSCWITRKADDMRLLGCIGDAFGKALQIV
jgi:hypothetical protein